jgi:hypothetical protein
MLAFSMLCEPGLACRVRRRGSVRLAENVAQAAWSGNGLRADATRLAASRTLGGYLSLQGTGVKVEIATLIRPNGHLNALTQIGQGADKITEFLARRRNVKGSSF